MSFCKCFFKFRLIKKCIIKCYMRNSKKIDFNSPIWFKLKNFHQFWCFFFFVIFQCLRNTAEQTRVSLTFTSIFCIFPINCCSTIDINSSIPLQIPIHPDNHHHTGWIYRFCQWSLWRKCQYRCNHWGFSSPEYSTGSKGIRRHQIWHSTLQEQRRQFNSTVAIVEKRPSRFTTRVLSDRRLAGNVWILLHIVRWRCVCWWLGHWSHFAMDSCKVNHYTRWQFYCLWAFGAHWWIERNGEFGGVRIERW